MRPLRLIPGLAALALLAACGQKGPLYLPKPEPAVQPPVPTNPAPATTTAPAPVTLGQPQSLMPPARWPQPEASR